MAILLITFLLTVFADLVVAVNIGVILAVLHFLRRMADAVAVQQLSERELGQELLGQGLQALPRGVLVYEIDGPFFFGAVENFERALLQTHTDPHLLILRLRRVPFMDISGLQALEEVIDKLAKRGVRVQLCEANHRVLAKLKKTGIVELLGQDNYIEHFASALERASAAAAEPPHARRLSEYAENVLKTSRRFFQGSHDEHDN